MKSRCESCDTASMYMTVEEAARHLRIGRTLAYRLAHEYLATGGRSGLPVIRVGRLLRVRRSDLEQRYGITSSIEHAERELARFPKALYAATQARALVEQHLATWEVGIEAAGAGCGRREGLAELDSVPSSPGGTSSCCTAARLGASADFVDRPSARNRPVPARETVRYRSA